MELSLRLDTLGMVEVRYLRGRERFRDWPPFLLFAASRQARVLAYLTRETLEQLHFDAPAMHAKLPGTGQRLREVRNCHCFKVKCVSSSSPMNKNSAPWY